MIHRMFLLGCIGFTVAIVCAGVALAHILTDILSVTP